MAVATHFEDSPHTQMKQLLKSVDEVILDKQDVTKLALSCLFAKGHLLIEDRPGTGKTSLLKTLAKLLGLSSQRIQFTNDLLPADIIGTSIFNTQSQSFEFHQGPLFTHFLIADEINRATPRTQSACLQAMEESFVNVDRERHSLPSPFFLVATQNTQESAGTFPLPDSQLDRFLMRLEMGIPSREAERAILTGEDRHQWIEKLKPILSTDEVLKMMIAVENIKVAAPALDYLQDLVEKSRQLSQGLSPRGARDFYKAAKAYALCEGRDYVIPEDFQSVGVAVMGHRIFSDSNPSGKDLAKEIIHSVPIP